MTNWTGCHGNRLAIGAGSLLCCVATGLDGRLWCPGSCPCWDGLGAPAHSTRLPVCLRELAPSGSGLLGSEVLGSEVLVFWVLRFWGSGLLGFWSSGFWSSEVLVFWVLRFWSGCPHRLIGPASALPVAHPRLSGLEDHTLVHVPAAGATDPRPVAPPAPQGCSCGAGWWGGRTSWGWSLLIGQERALVLVAC